MNCNVLKIVRQANGITVEEVVRRSGISKVYIFELESGKKLNASTNVIKKLAAAYNLTEMQMTELDNYYESLKIDLSCNADDDRKRRLTMIKALEMIENNLYSTEKV